MSNFENRTTIRAHPRKGTRGVREHTRSQHNAIIAIERRGDVPLSVVGCNCDRCEQNRFLRERGFRVGDQYRPCRPK